MTIRVIGVDPGVSTAVAVLEDGEYTAMWPLTFWGAYHLIRGTFEPTDTTVVIEVATDTKVWQPNAGGRASGAKAMKVAQDVGACRREGELLIEGLRDLFDVKAAAPKGKLTAERFRLLTGYEPRTNQHQRDAAMLAWYEYQSRLTARRVAVIEELNNEYTR